MLKKNSNFLVLVLIFLSANCLFASQGDELWELIQNGTVENLEEWTSNPFNNPATAVDESGLTLLHMAASRGKLLFVQHLLEYIFPNIQSDYGLTPLHEAVRANHAHLVAPLTFAGADIDALDVEESTPLHLATISKAAPAVEALLKHQAKIDKQDLNGDTALHIAVDKNLSTVVESLLQHDPEFEVQNNSGRTAIELASVKTIADMLFDRGAIPPTQDELDEEWRRDDVRDMLSISAKRYYSRLYSTQKLLDQNHNIPAALQDLITIDMLTPKARRKEIRGMATSHRRKRCRRDANESLQRRKTLGSKQQKRQ